MRIFGKGKCKLIANCANFWQGKCKFIANFSATMETSLSSISLSLSLSLSLYLSLSLSLSLSPKVPHAQYRKRFRASYNERQMACSRLSSASLPCVPTCVHVDVSWSSLCTCAPIVDIPLHKPRTIVVILTVPG